MKLTDVITHFLPLRVKPFVKNLLCAGERKREPQRVNNHFFFSTTPPNSKYLSLPIQCKLKQN